MTGFDLVGLFDWRWGKRESLVSGPVYCSHGVVFFFCFYYTICTSYAGSSLRSGFDYGLLILISRPAAPNAKAARLSSKSIYPIDSIKYIRQPAVLPLRPRICL